MRRIDPLWAALEADATTKEGWWFRLIDPDTMCEVYAGYNADRHQRAVLTKIPRPLVPSPRLWPRCNGLEPVYIEIEGDCFYGVALKIQRFADVFSDLMEDMVDRMALVEDSSQRAQCLISQLGKWHKFLSNSAEGLSEEAQRGLWGELHLLSELIQHGRKPEFVFFWTGPDNLDQDFQILHTAIEVKTTLARDFQTVKITSERQLDPEPWDKLYLTIFALVSSTSIGKSLPSLVNSVREQLLPFATAAETFEDRLLAAGYIDAHAERYADQRYTVQACRVFRVANGFPSITPAGLPGGVYSVSYCLDTAFCRESSVAVEDFIDLCVRSL